MSSPAQPVLDVFLRKLENAIELTNDERSAVAALPFRSLDLKRNHDIAREGDRPSRCCMILEGMACWYKVTGDGRRQILNFCIPGDVPDLQSLHLPVLDATLATVGDCKVAFVDHEAMRFICTRHPRIAAVLWRATLVEAAIFREWVTNLGGRQALSRTAHLFCETVARMDDVGLVTDGRMEWPVTQAQIGEATGMSTVHVNRVVQELRARKLISLKGTKFRMLDWEGLQAIGDFDPMYLHLHQTDVATGRMSLRVAN